MLTTFSIKDLISTINMLMPPWLFPSMLFFALIAMTLDIFRRVRLPISSALNNDLNDLLIAEGNHVNNYVCSHCRCAFISDEIECTYCGAPRYTDMICDYCGRGKEYDQDICPHCFGSAEA